MWETHRELNVTSNSLSSVVFSYHIVHSGIYSIFFRLKNFRSVHIILPLRHHTHQHEALRSIRCVSHHELRVRDNDVTLETDATRSRSFGAAYQTEDQRMCLPVFQLDIPPENTSSASCWIVLDDSVSREWSTCENRAGTKVTGWQISDKPTKSEPEQAKPPGRPAPSVRAIDCLSRALLTRRGPAAVRPPRRWRCWCYCSCRWWWWWWW